MGRGIRMGMGEVRWGEGGKAMVEGCVMGVFRKVKGGHSDWCCFWYDARLLRLEAVEGFGAGVTRGVN